MRVNEDGTLDCEIVIDEIECMIRRLKKGKSAGKDGEHINYIWGRVLIWLKFVFNCILTQEVIPSCFKTGINVPIFKGKGRSSET